MSSGAYRSVDRRLLYNCCTSNSLLQLPHRILRHLGRSLDVEALRRTHVLVSQNALDRCVRNSKLFEVGGETATIRLPALLLEAVRLQRRADHPVGQVIEVECAPHTVRKNEAGGTDGPDRIEQEAERLNEGHQSRIIDVLVRLRVLERRAPHAATDREHIPAIVVPPKATDLPFA